MHTTSRAEDPKSHSGILAQCRARRPYHREAVPRRSDATFAVWCVGPKRVHGQVGVRHGPDCDGLHCVRASPTGETKPAAARAIRGPRLHGAQPTSSARYLPSRKEKGSYESSILGNFHGNKSRHRGISGRWRQCCRHASARQRRARLLSYTTGKGGNSKGCTTEP